MKNPLKIALFGLIVLSILVIGGILVMQSTSSALAQAIPTDTPSAGSSGAASPVPTTVAPSSGTPAGTLVALWDEFCVSKVPYTLLALPTDATFSITPPSGPAPTPIPGYTTADQTACNSVGVFRGQQVIVCRGPQLVSFSLHVTSGSATQDYQVPLKECALPHTSGPAATPTP